MCLSSAIVGHSSLPTYRCLNLMIGTAFPFSFVRDCLYSSLACPACWTRASDWLVRLLVIRIALELFMCFFTMILQWVVSSISSLNNISIWTDIIAHGWSMMTSSNGNIFRVTGHLYGEFTGEFPAQRPVTRGFDVFFDLCPNKRLSKQSWGDLRRYHVHYDVTVMSCTCPRSTTCAYH